MPVRGELRIANPADGREWTNAASSQQSISKFSQDGDLQFIVLFAALAVILCILLVRFVPLTPEMIGPFTLS